jgi:hypothetical protein
MDFRDDLAIPRFPRPVVKWAVLVPIQENYCTWITPEWDDDGTAPQNFEGSYYLVIDEDGKGRYGSAKLQWENMHHKLPMTRLITGVPAIGWVKVEVPTGYHVTEDCVMVTSLIPIPGLHEVPKKAIKAGTLVLRQSGNEVQFVRPENEDSAYFSEDEARALGLYDMTLPEFQEWAVAQAMKTLVTS